MDLHPMARAMYKAFALDWQPNKWHGYDAALETKRPHTVTVRTCAEGPEETFKVYVLERWALLYTITFDPETPIGIVRDAVKRLIKEEGMR